MRGYMRKRTSPSTTRTTISVPRELRVRMNRFQRKNIVNWSHIAVEAWESYIDQKENSNGDEKIQSGSDGAERNQQG